MPIPCTRIPGCEYFLEQIREKGKLEYFEEEGRRKDGKVLHLISNLFGVFEIKQRAARTAQNPKTLQRVQVPPKRTVKFKVGRLMKQKLQGPAAGA